MDSEEHFFIDLIEAVRNERALYDKSHPFYTKPVQKNQAWQKVSKKTGRSKDECEKRWKLLREKFGRELNTTRRAQKTGDASAEHSNWKYFEHLIFLEVNLKSKTHKNTALSSDNNDPHSTLPLRETFCDNASSDFTSSPFNKDRDSGTEEIILKEFRSAISSWCNRVLAPPRIDDEDEFFIRNIVCMLKPLPVRKKDQIKKDIFNSIMTAREFLYEKDI